MKFLVDAHLPRRLAYRLRQAGHDAIHTRELPKGNRTGDNEIIDLSMREQRVVVTKDGDFVDTLILQGRPYKLLLISTGNISNPDLEAIFTPAIIGLCQALEHHDFVEFGRASYIIHF